MKFETTIKVYFDECDSAGVVFFANYYRIAHRCLEDYLKEMRIPWTFWFANPDWIVPLRKSQAEYLQPLFAGQSYNVTIAMSRMGESSITFAFEILTEENEVCARLETTHVFVDKKKKRKIKIPQTLRTKLAGKKTSSM